MSPGRRLPLLALVLLVGACATVRSKPFDPRVPGFWDAGTTRIVDPKLDGGEARIAFRAGPVGQPLDVRVRVLQGTRVIREVWAGGVTGGDPATRLTWDGRDRAGAPVDTGEYTVELAEARRRVPTLSLPLHVVRLGIIELAGRASGNDEWQMVYFKKGAQPAFFATPAIHEYRNTARPGDLSDLDLDDGTPRPPVPVHVGTDSPVLSGGLYATTGYNYPLAYRCRATPLLEARFGASATSSSGAPMGVGWPVPGHRIRVRVSRGGIELDHSGTIQPGAVALLDGPRMPRAITRIDDDLVWSWQYCVNGTGVWVDIPGSTTIPMRFYTTRSAPKFAAGASGTQYAGPWVEVADHWYTWSQQLGIDTDTTAGCIEAHVRGFFGNHGGLGSAIEGMLYDTYTMGGDGGATHYVVGGSMGLSALLDGHAHGIFFNCTDNMGATTTMLSMMGIASVRPVRLGSMSLRALWGIGATAYTTALWGSAYGHQFGYHHVVTRDEGMSIIDTCMQLDVDGDADATPGTPGWNVDRPWSGPLGYDALSSTNSVTKTLEALPALH